MVLLNHSPTSHISQMNGYQLMKFFYAEMEHSEDMILQCSAYHISIYTWIVELQNRVGWEFKRLDLPTDRAMMMSGIGSYKTYIRCVKELMQWGLITELKPAKNQHSARKITLYTPKWLAFLNQTKNKQEQTEDEDNEVFKAFDELKSKNEKDSATWKQNEKIKNEADKVEKPKIIEKEVKIEPKTETKLIETAFCPPELIDVKEHFTKMKYGDEEAVKFYHYYQTIGWKLGGKHAILDWHSLAVGWMSKVQQFKPVENQTFAKSFFHPTHSSFGFDRPNKNYHIPL